MKRALAFLMALTMCLSLCACGAKSESAPETASATASVTASSTATATASGTQTEQPSTPVYDTVTLKLSHHNSVDQPIHAALTKWADMLKEKSNGSITIDIYPAASLYNAADGQAAVEMGTLDMCLGDTSQMSTDVPAYALLSLPFMFDSYETADKVVYGEVGKAIDKLATESVGVVALGWTWNGFRNMCTTKPITSIEDCKNFKLRSPGADIYLDTFNLLGMSPTVVPWNEAYTSMQSNLVEGVESGLEAFYTQGFYKLGNNICLSRHMISIIGPIVNSDKWNSFSADTQQLMLDCWAECQAELNETVMAGEDSYKAKLADAGCTITEFTDRQALTDLFTPYWTKSAETGGYTDLLNQTLKIING